ncbi:MAG TPA: hypothetical protein DCZ92_14120 [Elusimicrobia bacterium]|nr:hypothetical protein [Elusimicrobiota bacterium]
MMRPLLCCLLLTASAAFGAEIGAAPKVSNWHVKSSPHFEVLYESAWSPSSIILELERMYSATRLTMSMFAPWMTREKAKIYIYASQASYQQGEFAPPKWSKGLAYSAKKTVVVYDNGDLTKLKATIAHELGHLYFEGYFAEKLTYSPQWLNEGLAVYLEDVVFPEGGPWSRALTYFPVDRRIPPEKFFDAKLDDIKTDAAISDWYLQSFATVSFLYKPNTRLQFKNFCSALRDGADVKTALWKTYRINDRRDFARRWNAWLEEYGAKPASNGTSLSSNSNSFTFKPMQFSSYTFTQFGLKK